LKFAGEKKKKKKKKLFILFELLVFKSFIILLSFDVRDEDFLAWTHITATTTNN